MDTDRLTFAATPVDFPRIADRALFFVPITIPSDDDVPAPHAFLRFCIFLHLWRSTSSSPLPVLLLASYHLSSSRFFQILPALLRIIIFFPVPLTPRTSIPFPRNTITLSFLLLQTSTP